MKKCFYALSAALIALTSCSSEEEPMRTEGGEVTPVTFSVALPEMIQSRAVEHDVVYGSGKFATKFEYGIYDKDGNLVISSQQADAPQVNEENADGVGMTHYLTVELLRGHTYEIVFWASAEESPYTFNPENKNVTIDYSQVKANDENCDAFFGNRTYTIDNEYQTLHHQYTVTLNRPFAQLNIITTDIEKASKLNASGLESVTVEVLQNPGAYSVLDTHTKKAETPTPGISFTANLDGWNLVRAGYNDSGDDLGKEQVDYHYLATCYLLTGIETNGKLTSMTGTNMETTDLCVTIKYKNGEESTFTKEGVRIQRNYRTNLYGTLLTNPANIYMVLDANFVDNDYNNEDPHPDSSDKDPQGPEPTDPDEDL